MLRFVDVLDRPVRGLTDLWVFCQRFCAAIQPSVIAAELRHLKADLQRLDDATSAPGASRGHATIYSDNAPELR